MSNGEKAAGDGAPLTLNGVKYAKGWACMLRPTSAITSERYAPASLPISV